MKNRSLKALLRKRGYTMRSGKGSHRIWTHPSFPRKRVVLTGKDGEDAPPYQVARVCRGQRFHRSACLYHR